jgi:hypothetical protein
VTSIEKRRERKRRYLERQKVAKYGPDAAGKDMRGRHGNHARGDANARWNSSPRRLTGQGYVAVRVPTDHPHAWGPANLKHFKYAYEHVLVMMESLGRSLLAGETVHHKNGNRADNRLENLELMTRSAHAAEHADAAQRDTLGRFQSDLPRVRQFPGATR